MMTIKHLRERFLAGATSPAAVVQDIFSRIRTEGERPVWISLESENRAVEQAASVDISLPLGGVPFAVKDNFDVAGMATTAGCPSFSYMPGRTAPVVQRLIDAGAVLIGKTNMDQFATGLVGTRSPYGACSSVYDSRYISGGSSSDPPLLLPKDCAHSRSARTPRVPDGCRLHLTIFLD